MTSYNRYAYLRRTIESLFASRFPAGSILYITDDASTDPRIHSYLESLIAPLNLEIEYNFRDYNVGVSINEHMGARYCFEHFTHDDYIVLINNDCICNPQWIWKLIEARESLKDARIGALTAFNYEYENKPQYGHRVIGWANELVRIKESCGALGCMVNRELIFALPPHPHDGWDCRYIDICHERGYSIYATGKSYIQHIGREGMHSRDNGGIDLAIDFEPGCN